MPSGTSDSKFTNKTEFMRYIDANPSEIKGLESKFKLYQSNHPRGPSFGSWLRAKHFTVFNSFYNQYWLKHPELYEKVYAQQGLLSV